MIKSIQQYIEELQLSGIKQIYINKDNSIVIPEPDYEVSDKAEFLKAKAIEYAACNKCPLHRGRNKFVYGEGNPDAICMVIGEGPGEHENLQGRPFVGPAGQLLDKMLAAINIQRNDVYIANIVKCRPPNNRNPEAQEREACLPYLIEQINVVKPKIFLFLGLVAAQTLLKTNQSMAVLRETPQEFMQRTAYVTYHPSALLRNPNWKKPAWIDLQNFQKAYESLL
jgi:DNA polymerase